MIRIVITGPESTGKTALAQNLAEAYDTIWLPEFARTYVEQLGRPYGYDDVVAIARNQIEQEKRLALQGDLKILFLDTWLILTKVWFDLVFDQCPAWLIDQIKSSDIDLFLVCCTDIEWVADSVRENGGARRAELLKIYCQEIESFGFNYELVNGLGESRLANALIALKKHGF
jgi:nicotinamide riboside kinase